MLSEAHQSQSRQPVVGPRTLILVRHGESSGNAQNIFTGWLDLQLTEKGRAEAREAGDRLKKLGIIITAAFASNLTRASESCSIMLAALGQSRVQPIQNVALNERNYGDLTGLNKEEARKRWGSDQVAIWRRSYHVSPPNGESLRDTAARVLPYYLHAILPAIMQGSGVLIVAHGNSLRALVMALDSLTPETVPQIEIATGEALIYTLHPDTSVADRVVVPPE